MKHDIDRLQKLCRKSGFSLAEFGNGHFQIQGEDGFVNYWPTSRRKTLHGTLIGTHRWVTPERAVALAAQEQKKHKEMIG